MKITTYKNVKVAVSDTEVFIPQQPFYCFETGVRRSIRIVPVWTSWNEEQYNKPEEIFEISVTCVYLSFKCKVEKFNIPVRRIEDYYNSSDNSNEAGFVKTLVNKWYDTRTKEQFESDLNFAIENINTP